MFIRLQNALYNILSDTVVQLFIEAYNDKSLTVAIDEFDAGHYEESGEAWQRVLAADGNYDLAYIGIGRSLLRQEKYKEAMKLAKECSTKLDNATKAVNKILKENGELEDFKPLEEE